MKKLLLLEYKSRILYFIILVVTVGTEKTVVTVVTVVKVVTVVIVVAVVAVVKVVKNLKHCDEKKCMIKRVLMKKYTFCTNFCEKIIF